MEAPPKFLPYASERTGIEVPTLRDWAAEGRGPRMWKVGKRWATTDAEIDRWLREQREHAGGSHVAA